MSPGSLLEKLEELEAVQREAVRKEVARIDKPAPQAPAQVLQAPAPVPQQPRQQGYYEESFEQNLLEKIMNHGFSKYIMAFVGGVFTGVMGMVFLVLLFFLIAG